MRVTWVIEADLPDPRPGTARTQLQGILDLFTQGKARITDETITDQAEDSPEVRWATLDLEGFVEDGEAQTPQHQDGRHLRVAPPLGETAAC